MTLKLKFTLLVATCVLILLGSYYFFAVRSANNAIIGFNEQSAVIFNSSLLEDDKVENLIKKQDEQATIRDIAIGIYAQFPEQVFILTKGFQLEHSSLEQTETSVKINSVESGFQFLIKQLQLATIVVQISGPQVEFEWQGQSYQLFWFPKVTLDRQEQQSHLRDQINNSFLKNLFMLSAVAIVLSWCGASYFLQPLKTLKHSFEDIKQGQLDTRIEPKHQDEVGELITGFNQLTAWLQGLHQQYAQMNSDLSHELRTPINAMQSRLEAMEDGLLSLSNEQIVILQKELKQIKQLIDDLTLLSPTSANALTLNLSETNVSQLAQDVLSRYTDTATDMNVQLQGQITPDVYWTLDESRLRQVLINLLDNAFKYGTSGGEISLVVKASENTLTILVTDNGEGLSQTQQEQVFKRFYRVHQDRNQKGMGLGLPICHYLVSLMKGNIELKSAPNQGCVFNLTFYQAS